MAMTIGQMEAIIEAVLFTMGESVETSKLAVAIDQDINTTKKIVRNLSDKYKAGVLEPSFGIHITPMWAALAMSLSSISVVLNSLKLKLAKI